METAGRLNNIADLAGFERKSSILKLLLHIAPAEPAQVPPLAGRAAVRLLRSQLGERRLARRYLAVVLLDLDPGLVLGADDAVLFPARRAATISVLDEEVGGTDLARAGAVSGHGGRVVRRHVHLELVRVRTSGRLPARRGVRGVEVVGKVLALRQTNFPVGRQAGVLVGWKKRSSASGRGAGGLYCWS